MLLNQLFALQFKIYMGLCATRQNRISSKSNATPAIYIPKIQDFIFLQLIGKGGFSKVWKIQEKQTHKIYALKVMDKAKIIAKKSVNSILMERNILSSLHQSECGQIAKLRAAFQDKQKLYLLLDYFEGRSLRDHLNRGLKLDELQIKFFISQLLDALQCLYDNNIIHGDIKPQNILFDKQGKPFLADFGTASYLTQNNSGNNSGTIGYMAPQVMQLQSHSFTADYYAVGIVTYELFFCKLPYQIQTIDQILKQIWKKPVCKQNFPQLTTILPQASSFITQLLERRQRLRLGFNGGIKELIDHPWLRIISEGSIPQIQTNVEKESREHKYFNSTDAPYKNSLSKEQIRKILQRNQVQQMFKSYDYLPEVSMQFRKIQTMRAKDEPAQLVLKHCLSY